MSRFPSRSVRDQADRWFLNEREGRGAGWSADSRSASFVRPAWRGVPSRSVCNLLEVCVCDVRLTEVQRVRHNDSCHEPDISIGLGKTLEVFFQTCIRAVGDAVPAQVSGPEVSRHYSQIAFRSFAHGLARHRSPRGQPFPGSDRVTLRLRLIRCWRRTAKMQKTSLRAGVGIDPQCVAILPINVQPAGHTQQSGRTIRFALILAAQDLCRIEGVRYLAPLKIQRNTCKIAFDRHDHAPTPIFRNHGYPITG